MVVISQSNPPKKRSKQFDWETLPLSKWNSTTFRAYIDHLNMEKFGQAIIYTGATIKITNKLLKQNYEEFGKEAVKLFIEESVAGYAGNFSYPTIAFPIMIRFNKARLMPSCVARSKQMEAQQTGEVSEQVNAEEVW